MPNGAMKLAGTNIIPASASSGSERSAQFSPGKYTQISNPNARIEPFEVNTQTLMQYGTISDKTWARW